REQSILQRVTPSVTSVGPKSYLTAIHGTLADYSGVVRCAFASSFAESFLREFFALVDCPALAPRGHISPTRAIPIPTTFISAAAGAKTTIPPKNWPKASRLRSTG